MQWLKIQENIFVFILLKNDPQKKGCDNDAAFSISDLKTQQWVALFPKGACFFITIP